MATQRSRPTTELLERLREGKRQFHEAQRELPLEEKVRQLLELQKIDYEIRRSRGDQLQPWEKPWEIEP